MKREIAVSELAGLVNRIKPDHPIRVGIDVVDASGKTKFANELFEPLKGKNRDVIRISVDGFHNPRKVRYLKGSISPPGYYENSFNNDAIASYVLKPLGPEGSLKYKSAIFDFITDSEIDQPFHEASIDSILLFEGVFLHNPLLTENRDFTIFVHADFNVILKRAQERDIYLFGNADKIKETYEAKYIPGQPL